jgi:hypothetical protein
MPNKVFVSPGVYTSERDLSFVTRQVGITTLGLVGETTIGPAFQPIFVQDYGEFTSFFGGLDATKDKVTAAPKYELPYIAKSYLSQSNQLFVTRVLGLSGYDAGVAYAIVLDGAIDGTTEVLSGSTTYSGFNPTLITSGTTSYTTNLFSITRDFSGFSFKFTYTFSSNDPVISQLLATNEDYLIAYFDSVIDTGATIGNIGPLTLTSGNSVTGVTATNLNCIFFFQSAIDINTGNYFETLNISGVTTYTTGSTYPTNLFDIKRNYNGDTGQYTYTINSDDEIFSQLVLDPANTTYLNTFFNSVTGTGATSSNIGPLYLSSGLNFTGATTANLDCIYYATGQFDFSQGDYYDLLSFSGTVDATTATTFTGIDGVEDRVVTLLRPRGFYQGETLIHELSGATSGVGSVEFDLSVSGASNDPLGDFQLTGTSALGPFSYNLSLDRTKKNYITKVLGRTDSDGKTALFVEEIYDKMLDKYIEGGKVKGLKLELVNYDFKFDNYKQIYQPAVTPWIVSELRGSNLLRLFRFWTISDGNAANQQFKISITNIKLDDKEFDVVVRSFYDTDANPVIFEKFTKCVMDPKSASFVGRKIGTLNGDYASKSNYVLIEMDEESDTSDAFPAGFVGYPLRDYKENGNTSIVEPSINYKKTYGSFENKRKAYLGLSDIIGFDQDFFDYKGLPKSSTITTWTGMTKGFHMDVNVTGATIDNVLLPLNSTGGTYSPVFEFETGAYEFKSETGVVGTDYEKIFSRKFTFAPYGGFDGWDIYRDTRTNTERYTINGTKGILGLVEGNFKNITLSNGERGISSDYYAYLEAIWTFKNPESVNINVFATPGIDTFNHPNLIEAAIEMVEADRADSLYIVTTPDIDASGDVMKAEEIVDTLDGSFDSNYTATYWPWIQVNDTENNSYIWMPPTRDVVRNIALTDNIAFPWFAVAGIQRGDVNCVKARIKLTQEERDTLYEGRVNPITTFASDGVKIWGNKTLQEKDTALNRINVRRLLLQARKLISAVSIRLLFEQNDSIVRNQFLSLVNPILDNIRSERGLTDFRVVLDETPESIDRSELNGKIYIKPTKALEFIILEFNVTNSGASFENI